MGQDGHVSQSLRVTLSLIAGLLFLALVGATAVGVESAGPRQVERTSVTTSAAVGPNVLVFLTDDMRKDDLSYLPNVRRLLVQQGMTFTENQSPHPLCCPARAELMTGQYAQNNGVHHNTGAYGGWKAFDPSSTIATWAQDAGYATAIHGKHLNKFDPDAPADPGWDNFDILLEPATDYENFTFFGGDTFTDDYVTTRLDERTVDDIDRWAGKRPFLIFANHVAPHMWVPASRHARGDGDRRGLDPPAEAAYANALTGLRPKAFDDRSFNESDISDKEAVVRGRAKLKPAELKRLNLARIRSLLSVDEAVAHAYAALEKAGELDNTYFVFTSDNGYALGEHRYTGKDRLSDEILDVPLVVRGPGIPAGTPHRSRGVAGRPDRDPVPADVAHSHADHRRRELRPDAARPGRPRPARHDADPDRGQVVRRPLPRVGLPRGADPALLLCPPHQQRAERRVPLRPPPRPGRADQPAHRPALHRRTPRARASLPRARRLLRGSCNRDFGPPAPAAAPGSGGATGHIAM